MKNIKDTQFSIEKTTLRELTSVEASAVGGGTGPTNSLGCLPQPTEPTHPTNNQSATCANTTVVNTDTGDNTTWIGDFNTTNNNRY